MAAACTGALRGRTVFVTGASRGIGRAIALKAAQDGANVVIAAKSATPHAKLEGTIFTVAKEVEDAGGRALPCMVDIRDEAGIEGAVKAAVAEFGGIDVLVNNASAISLTGTAETPVKKVDLMWTVNARGTYVTTKACLPHLMKSRAAHILTMSPPLNMQPVWFKNHPAYTIAKYGMSMCVLGHAAEFAQHGIAVNALWPKTAIWTAAMGMLGGQEARAQCRKPSIVADAAYVILSKDPREPGNSGNFFIDEAVLRDAGVNDMAQYAEVPGHELMMDFFLNEDQIAAAGAALPAQPKPKRKAPPPEGDEFPRPWTGDAEQYDGGRSVLHWFLKAGRFLRSRGAVGAGAMGIYRFHITGTEACCWDVRVDNEGGGTVAPCSSDAVPEVEFTLSTKDCHRMFEGRLRPTMAFLTGRLKIKGDLSIALKADRLLAVMREKGGDS